MSAVFIRAPQLKADYGLPKTTVDRMEARDEFPRRISLGGRSIAWKKDEVDAWAAGRTEARDQAIARRAARDSLLP